MSKEVSQERFEQLIGRVREAGEFLLSVWPGRSRDQSSLSITQKDDGSLVSSADMRSNEILMAALRSIFPEDAIFSEEVVSDPQSIRNAQRVWIIDPLDGTAAFLHGRDDFSVLVGLSVDRAAAAGIMFFPARGEMITARVGGGAWCNGSRLSVSSVSAPRPNRVYMRKCPRVIPELACPEIDSGLAFAHVARGELDGIILRMLTHREWDIAAPMAVLREAGAKVTDEVGREIPLGMGGVDFNYLVVSNGRTHDRLLAVVREINT